MGTNLKFIIMATKETILEYAKKQINLGIVEESNGIQRVFISQEKLYIEFPNGKNLQIAEDEIKYQATEYLQSEIENIKNN